MQRMQKEREGDEKKRVKTVYCDSIIEFSPCGRYCWKIFLLPGHLL